MFANIVCPPKTGEHIPFVMYFLIQIIDVYCIFSHSLAKLANMTQGKKVGKHTPPHSRMLQRHKGTTNPKNIPPNVPYEKCSHV